MSEQTIGLVGAGMAGLAAARALVAAGARVQVFEKSRGRGGRCSTRRRDPWAFDHGAAFFTVRDPAFATVVEALEDEGCAAVWPGRFGTLRQGAIGPDPGAGPRWTGTPGMSALGRGLAAGLDLLVNTRVIALEGGPGAWFLRDADGVRRGPFEVVLVTAPPEQAAALLAPAPDLAERIGAVRFDPCIAAMFGFADPIDLPLDGAFIEDAPLVWAARETSKPGRTAPDGGEAWVLHAGPEWSAARLATARPEDLLPGFLAAFADATGLEPPAPVHASVHRWRYARAVQVLGEPCLWDGERGLGVAGDGCVGERVEGAWRSGHALAARVLAG